MNTPNHAALIAQQVQGLQQLKEGASEAAAALADRILERYESEVCSQTDDGFVFDFSGTTVFALSSSLMVDFQEMAEQDIFSLFQRLQAELTAAGESAVMDVDDLSLQILRKGADLQTKADPMIERALQSAKPGIGRALGILLGDWLRDPLEQGEAIEKDMARDGQAAQRALLGLTEALRTMLEADAMQLIVRGCASYERGLQQLRLAMSEQP